MKRSIPLLLAGAAVVMGTTAQAQRYLTEFFSNANVTVTSDVIYGTNIDIITSNLASPQVPTDVVALQTIANTTGVYGPQYYDTQDASTALKVTDLRMDVYQPNQSIDPETERPLVIYIHTGNALPPVINQSPTGAKTDSCAVEVCRRMARRGYVAVSISYRLGWTPTAPTELERRRQLLNAIYRAIHDVRQCVRVMKANAGTYRIDPNKIIVFGEGTGGYISLAHTTLDDPDELFVPKFLPDPFDPTVSYIDTLQVGNINGFNGNLTLYRPNGQDHTTQFCVNMGGALADTTWLEPGDAPMVAFHTVFDPFAPFTYGIVEVPNFGPVVDVPGSNYFMPFVNAYGNNSSFASLPDADPFTHRARSLYGTTHTHGTTNVTINTDVEGLFPMVRPDFPDPALEEASPWQWWDPNGAAANSPSFTPPFTVGQLASASNPDMSANKGRTYLDTVMGYLNPRIVCALQLGPCSLVGIQEENTTETVDVFPNPATDRVTIVSGQGLVRRYRLLDVNGRQVAMNTVNMQRFDIERNGLAPGTYFVELEMDFGKLMRKLMLD